MFWIALHCPLLSLESLRATLGADDAARPVALMAAHRLVAVDATAAQRGLEPGMRRATALALAPDLLPGEADPARDAAALAALAHAALAFTPMVAVEPPATVLLEVRASLRCFGGGARLLQRLLAAAGPLGHRLQVASAPTPLGASLLARWRDDHAGFMLMPGDRLAALAGALADAPLSLLDSARAQHEALLGVGLRTVADLRALPRDGLARRFGAALLDDVDRALGRRPDPREPLLPPETFSSRLELFARADTTAQVLHGAGVLLARLVAWAQARQVRIAAFTLQMRHEPRHRGDAAESTALRLELAEPALDLDHLGLLLRERLDRVELAAPTLELDLDCRETVHAPAPNAELFPTRQSEAQGLVRLLERLRARLGDEQVLCVAPRTDHRPECASPLQPLAAGAAPRPRRSDRRRAARSEPAAGAAHVPRPARPGTPLSARSAVSSPVPSGTSAPGPAASGAGASGVASSAPASSGGAASRPSSSRPARPTSGSAPPPPPGPPSRPASNPAQEAAAIAAALFARAGFPVVEQRRRAASHRPVWLVDAPQPLAERDDRPIWQGRPIRLLAGPERVESGWWDGGLATRDYFVAQVDDGALVWVYRTRLADDTLGGWFLHGWFG